MPFTVADPDANGSPPTNGVVSYRNRASNAEVAPWTQGEHPTDAPGHRPENVEPSAPLNTKVAKGEKVCVVRLPSTIVTGSACELSGSSRRVAQASTKA